MALKDWKAGKENDKDFKAFYSRNKMLRIWKTAIVKKGKRTGKYTYDLAVNRTRTGNTSLYILQKAFTSMPKAVKYAKYYMGRNK